MVCLEAQRLRHWNLVRETESLVVSHRLAQVNNPSIPVGFCPLGVIVLHVVPLLQVRQFATHTIPLAGATLVEAES